MKSRFLTIAFMAISICSFAQKKPLDHSVYDGWKSIGGFSLTKDGGYSMFYINPQEGDSELVSFNVTTGQMDTIHRGNSYKITENGKYAAMTIKPKIAETKAAKRKKLNADQMPKDSLGIYNLQTKELKKYPYLKGMKTARYISDFVAFQTTPPADTAKGKKPAKKEKEEGSDLMIYRFSTGVIDTIKYVTDYDFSKGGDTLFIVQVPNSKDSLYKDCSGLYMYNPYKKSMTAIYNIHKKQTVKLPTVSDNNRTLAFYAKLDTAKVDAKNVSVLVYRDGYEKAKIVADNKMPWLPEKYVISESRSLQMDSTGQRLFFGISPIQREKDTTLMDSEISKLDIWHYKEPHLQTVQLINLQRDLKRSFVCKVELDGEPAFAQLAKEDYPIVNVPEKWSSQWGYSVSDKNYQLESQWSANPHRDLWIVSVKDGKSKLLLKDVYIQSVSASPEGKFLTWFNLTDRNWYSYEVASDKIRNISKDITTSLTDELHDTPDMAPGYGSCGWMKDDAAFFIKDRYDVWKLDPKGEKSSVNFTDGIGRTEKKSFDIVDLSEMLLPPGTPGIVNDPVKPGATVYFSVFDEITKDNGYYYKDLKKKKPVMTKWVLEPYTLLYLTKAKKGPVVTYVKQNFTESPNLWITKDNFKTQTKITDINPQQKDYNWGTVELIKWKSKTGIDLEGLLYKPEDFDPSKKYPMIVYFYERNSQYLNLYRAPAPSRSTINVTYFVSNGYLVFIPDITYEIGHPGKSALNCIVPGVEKICENSWADRDNVAIQGQSWGGYQVAYMVTQPQVFKWKAAGAGAPVSNMTSAYGGIRWGTGVVRQFQYEHTQSRIGKNLWDGLDLYLENSPIFFADKIETPLLIMSNDNDEAVPWTQGIEYFTALKRLGKPAWMLQYNKETHNLSDRVNAKDLSIRLSQFFDHYLKGAPMPVWMSKGVPATLKGIDWGLELDE